jgi:hypothetical protein
MNTSAERYTCANPFGSHKEEKYIKGNEKYFLHHSGRCYKEVNVAIDSKLGENKDGPNVNNKISSGNKRKRREISKGKINDTSPEITSLENTPQTV